MKSIPLHGTMHECKCPYCTATVGAVTVSEKTGRTSDFPPVMLLPLRPPAENGVAVPKRKPAQPYASFDLFLNRIASKHEDVLDDLTAMGQLFAEVAEDRDEWRAQWDARFPKEPFPETIRGETVSWGGMFSPEAIAARMQEPSVFSEADRARKRPNPPTISTPDADQQTGPWGRVERSPDGWIAYKYDGERLNTGVYDKAHDAIHDLRSHAVKLACSPTDTESVQRTTDAETRAWNWQGAGAVSSSLTVTPDEKQALLLKLETLRDCGMEEQEEAVLWNELRDGILNLQRDLTRWKTIAAHRSSTIEQQEKNITAREQERVLHLARIQELSERSEHFRQERDTCRAAQREAIDCLRRLDAARVREETQWPEKADVWHTDWRNILDTARNLVMLAHPTTREGDQQS